MKNVWVLQREKNDRLILRQIAADDVIKYSYTRIPITTEQAEKTLRYCKWTIDTASLLPTYILSYKDNPDKYKSLLNRFMDLVKSHADEIEIAPIKRVKTDVCGTSKLIRTKDKSCIRIASRTDKRTGKTTDNTTINAVCIDNEHREQFFRDVRQYNGMPPSGYNYCLYVYNGNVFEWWSKFMTDEYIRQSKNINKKK